MSSALIEAIASQLEGLGLPVERGKGTDISVDKEFLAAGWSTGKKSITYQTRIRVDEARRTVFMWEKTTEVGQGFSFGTSSESSFQTGKTLMRTVKSVQYGPDGKAYEVDLELGAIPTSVKQIAIDHGWDFKTVIRQSKAMHDADAVHDAPTTTAAAAAEPGAAAPGSAAPAAPPPTSPPPAGSKAHGGGKGALIAVVALAIIAVLFLLVLKSSAIGWVVSLVVVVGVFFGLRAVSARRFGTIAGVAMWLVAALVVFIAGALTAAPSAEESPSGAPSPAASGPAEASAPAAPSNGATTGFELVSAGLVSDADVIFSDAAGYDANVVMIGRTDPGSTSAGEVHLVVAKSTDGGGSWTWGGELQTAGECWPEAVMLEPEGAIIVGSEYFADQDTSSAFIAAAMAPDFVPQQIAAPDAFAGRFVDLNDIANVDGTWVIVGSVDYYGFIWRSSDQGESWTKQAIDTGERSFVAESLTIGPDGSWNIVGSINLSQTGFSTYWLRSSDAGRTFTPVQPDAFVADVNENAIQLVLSPNGAAAVLGWTDQGDFLSNALFVSDSTGAMRRLGEANLPDQPGDGLFLSGIMFYNDTLLAFGSPQGLTRTDTVQFWALAADDTWSPTAQIVGPGPSIVGKLLIGGDTVLAVGMLRPAGEYQTFGAWRGSLTASGQ